MFKTICVGRILFGLSDEKRHDFLKLFGWNGVYDINWLHLVCKAMHSRIGNVRLCTPQTLKFTTQLEFACLKLTMETLEQCVTFIQR